MEKDVSVDKNKNTKLMLGLCWGGLIGSLVAILILNPLVAGLRHSSMTDLEMIAQNEVKDWVYFLSVLTSIVLGIFVFRNINKCIFQNPTNIIKLNSFSLVLVCIHMCVIILPPYTKEDLLIDKYKAALVGVLVGVLVYVSSIILFRILRFGKKV
ncbi:MAG: hypothetical protein HY819_02970 [Acidobacteria bacterium]|nr:hypothetical protein [Acidobacteriota bacterium]